MVNTKVLKFKAGFLGKLVVNVVTSIFVSPLQKSSLRF
jgi:hypothetical protein